MYEMEFTVLKDTRSDTHALFIAPQVRRYLRSANIHILLFVKEWNNNAFNGKWSKLYTLCKKIASNHVLGFGKGLKDLVAKRGLGFEFLGALLIFTAQNASWRGRIMYSRHK